MFGKGRSQFVRLRSITFALLMFFLPNWASRGKHVVTHEKALTKVSATKDKYKLLSPVNVGCSARMSRLQAGWRVGGERVGHATGGGRVGVSEPVGVHNSVDDRHARASGALPRRGSMLWYAMEPQALALDGTERLCALTTALVVPFRFAGCMWIEINLRAIRL